MNLRAINLNLLPILQQILRTRSVTLAAETLNVSQPAVSSALRQLRGILQDEILVRKGQNAHLTPGAAALVDPLDRLLCDLSVALFERSFAPPTATRRFTIATTDYVIAIIGPRLFGIVDAEAPNCVLQFQEIGPDWLERLGRAQLDMIIAPEGMGMLSQAALGSAELWRDNVVCIVAEENRKIGSSLTLEEFEACSHVGFQLNAVMPGLEHPIMARNMLARRRVCIVPHLTLVPALVAGSDCLGIVYRRMLKDGMLAGIRPVRPPVAFPDFAFRGYWAAATDQDAAHLWLREALRRAAASGKQAPSDA